VSKVACYHRAVRPSGLAARAFLTGCALTLSPVTHSQPSAQASSFNDLLTELAAGIVTSLAPNEHIQIVAADPTLARDLASLLARRGVRSAEGGGTGATVVTVTCSTTLSERLCAADVRRGQARELVSVHRRHDGGVALLETPLTTPAAVTLVLELRSLLAQNLPILDVAFAGTDLLALHPSMLARYQRASGGWRLQDTRPIASRRAWPRDLRGRVAVEGTRFDVFLPGMSCRGTIDPFELACGDGEPSWPLDFENAGMTRNYFVSPEGERYYAVASLGPEAGARWLAAKSDGHLVFLDETREPFDIAAGSGDELAGLSTRCASGSLVLLPVRSSTHADGDALRLFRVTGRRLLAATPPVALPGMLTALWARTGATSATAVSHNRMTGIYEAFEVGVSCGR
jgi:hypothetical protein